MIKSYYAFLVVDVVSRLFLYMDDASEKYRVNSYGTGGGESKQAYELQ